MTAPAAVGTAEVRFDEVYLAGSTGQGPALVGGLALFANEQGITVLGPEPSSVRTMSWKRASTVAFRTETLLPDGRGAVTLEIEIDGSPLRFFVPSAGLGPGGARTLEERIAGLARVPTALTPPKPMGEPATAGVPGLAGVPGDRPAPTVCRLLRRAPCPRGPSWPLRPVGRFPHSRAGSGPSSRPRRSVGHRTGWLWPHSSSWSPEEAPPPTWSTPGGVTARVPRRTPDRPPP